MASEKLKWSAFGVQCLAASCISFLGTQTGLVSAWPSYTLANFTSNATVLSAPMTTMQVSLLGSLTTMGGLIASPFCGYVFNSLGRKYATVFFGLPFVIFWLIVLFSTNTLLILFAMTLAGVGIAGQNVSLIFISEISHDSIRGGLTAISGTGYFFGLLISYILGGHLTYYQVAYTHLAVSILCIGLLLLLKESPVYLVLKGREEEAAKSIAFYNQVDYTCKLVEAELKKIKIQIDPRLEQLLECENDAKLAEELLKNQDEEKNVRRSEPAWKILRKSESSKRALVTVLVLIAATIMMGSVVLQVYAEPLFMRAVPSISSNLCSILLAIDFLLASIVCILVIDKFGRKNLLILTALISGICTLLLGVQLIVEFAPHWFTAFLIYAYSFFYTIGCAVIPFVLAAEVFLPEVRSLCNGICMAFVWFVMFITLFVFHPLVEAMGLGQVFCGFSGVCFLGALYTYFKLPETKGMSVDAIQLAFLKI